MTDRHAALLRLLQDDDPETVTLIKQQLGGGGVDTLSELRALLTSAKGNAARHLREVFATVEKQQTDALFGQFCQRFGEWGDLEEAAWRLAATFLPGEDFQLQRQFLDKWGAEVARRFQKADTELDRIETLIEYLGDELHFRGNSEDYYNIVNSLLPEVIENRVGIPITLSLVYIFVGRRAGMIVDGVGLPGHFIVRCGAHFFDPFHGGRRIGLEECRLLLEQHGQKLTAEHLQPTTPRQILLRMLTNLYCLAAPSDPALAAKLTGWMEALGNVEARG